MNWRLIIAIEKRGSSLECNISSGLSLEQTWQWENPAIAGWKEYLFSYDKTWWTKMRTYYQACSKTKTVCLNEKYITPVLGIHVPIGVTSNDTGWGLLGERLLACTQRASQISCPAKWFLASDHTEAASSEEIFFASKSGDITRTTKWTELASPKFGEHDNSFFQCE